MAKRAKASEPSEPEAGIVKVVDPLFDDRDEADAKPEALPAPSGAPAGQSFGERVRRFLGFLLSLAALLVILGIVSLALYYALPLLYQRYIVPVEQNTSQVMELQSRQEQTEQQLADLQTRLGTIETVQNQHDGSLTELDQRLSDIETETTARTQSLAALENMQSELQSQNEAASAELQRQIDLLKAMELLSRARLFMYQSNFGLAEQDVQIARDLLAMVRPDAPAPASLAEELDAVILRLDLTLSNLPNFPVAASDDLDIAWQILLSGLPQAAPTLSETPTPAGTLSPTPVASLTPRLQRPSTQPRLHKLSHRLNQNRKNGPFKEYMMVSGKCPHCGSLEIYLSDSPFYEAFMFKTEAGTDLFSVQCYLCLDCRAMELHAAERSPSLFGKNKALTDEVSKSANWKKVALK